MQEQVAVLASLDALLAVRARLPEPTGAAHLWVCSVPKQSGLEKDASWLQLCPVKEWLAALQL